MFNNMQVALLRHECHHNIQLPQRTTILEKIQQNLVYFYFNAPIFGSSIIFPRFLSLKAM